MKLFVDTADVKEIRRAAEAGLIDGVTTNPSLLSRAAGSEGEPREILKEICDTVDGPISAEIVATESDQMITEGRALAKIADNIVVKAPLTEQGLVACRKLRAEGIKVNVTLCFSPMQALLAAKANATFISPFVGRIDDISSDGMDVVRQIRVIYDNYDFDTEILVASVRHPMHVVEAALLGADIATIPPKILWQMFQHPLTDRGLEAFLDDWEKLPEDKRRITD
ncbi:MAG: fructose-6-phosphate aldolase [Gemmatimonadota bacterium]|jgi:transaldolase